MNGRKEIKRFSRREMKILVALTYYRPHTSGLTIYAERLAKAFVAHGHQVTILTSQYEKHLPREEYLEGVRIVRAPVFFRISKGVVMPTFGFLATKLVLESNVIQLHLPQLDAAGLAIRGRIFGKPTVITYHCDLQMPNGFLSWMANQGINLMNNLACLFTHRIIAYTEDYASHSKLLIRFSKKIKIINPPVELPTIPEKNVSQFIKNHNPLDRHPIIGMAARFATEKGVEVLLGALEEVITDFPNAQAWFAGPYKNIIGEEKYYEKLIPRISSLEKNGNWSFLGLLNPDQMVAFYKAIDMLVIPSLNSTESFGLVQIEAMLNGKPTIASDLPGVRQPVLKHHSGKIIPIGNSTALADAIRDIILKQEDWQINMKDLKRIYSPNTVSAEYEKLFLEIQKEMELQT